MNNASTRGLCCGLCLGIVLLGLSSAQAHARPVTYPEGRVWVMEAQDNQSAWRFGYSGSFRWSASMGGLYLDELADGESLDVTYVRAARLFKRWNWPTAQANVFGWGGVGYAQHTQGSDPSAHVGFQADFETRHLYTSVVSEHHEGEGWRYRTDTLSLGVAPYAHDFDGVAAWVVLKGMRTTHTFKDKPKAALMLRVFNPTWWVEAGIDSNGHLLGNVMFNF